MRLINEQLSEFIVDKFQISVSVSIFGQFKKGPLHRLMI